MGGNQKSITGKWKMTADGSTCKKAWNDEGTKSYLGDIASLAPEPEQLLESFWPIGWIFGLERLSTFHTFARCVLFLGVPPVLVTIMCWREGTLFLPGEAVGLLEHVGFLSIFAIHFLIVCLLPRTMRKCMFALKHIPSTIDVNLVREDELWQPTRQIFEDASRMLGPSRVNRWLKWMCVALGMLAVSFNAANTLNPYPVYGHDVWDSSQHITGYLAARMYFAFTWGLTIPITIYGLGVFCYLIHRLYSRIASVGDYGVMRISALGRKALPTIAYIHSAMLAVVINVVPLSVCTPTLIYTHGLNAPAIIGTVFWILLLCCFYFVPLFSVHVAMEKRRNHLLYHADRLYSSLNCRLTQLIANNRLDADKVRNDLLLSMERVHKIYSTASKTPVWPFDTSGLARFFLVAVLPVLPTVLRAFLSRKP